jgi:hypothetical protein
LARANTADPTRASASVAQAMAGAPPVSTAITARSPSTSTPATRPTALRSPSNTTVVSSPRMLWALVATIPSASTIPDPRPRPRPMPTTDGPARLGHLADGLLQLVEHAHAALLPPE